MHGLQANIRVQVQHAVGPRAVYPLSPSCSTEAVQSFKNFTETAPQPARRTREEVGKGNKPIALRFQTGGRHQTTLASFREYHDNFKTKTERFSKHWGKIKQNNNRNFSLSQLWVHHSFNIYKGRNKSCSSIRLTLSNPKNEQTSQ